MPTASMRELVQIYRLGKTQRTQASSIRSPLKSIVCSVSSKRSRGFTKDMFTRVEGKPFNPPKLVLGFYGVISFHNLNPGAAVRLDFPPMFTVQMNLYWASYEALCFHLLSYSPLMSGLSQLWLGYSLLLFPLLYQTAADYCRLQTVCHEIARQWASSSPSKTNDNISVTCFPRANSTSS